MATVKLTPIKDLKLAKYNPPSRLRTIPSLIKSIQEIGLLYPVLVDEKNRVVDGHRRIAAYQKIGLTEIPTLIAKGEQAALFAHVNSQTKRLTGNETLQIYLEEPRAITANTRVWFENAEEVIGKPMLARMAKEGLSYATYRVAGAIAKGADKDTPEAIKQVVKWLIHFRCTHHAERAMRNGAALGMLMVAAEKMKQIRNSYTIGK